MLHTAARERCDVDGSEVVRGSRNVLIERRVCLYIRVKKSRRIVYTRRENSTGNGSSTRVG